MPPPERHRADAPGRNQDKNKQLTTDQLTTEDLEYTENLKNLSFYVPIWQKFVSLCRWNSAYPLPSIVRYWLRTQPGGAEYFILDDDDQLTIPIQH